VLTVCDLTLVCQFLLPDGAVYNQWQSRVCYWHIQKLKAADPSGAMGGFTRLLHR